MASLPVDIPPPIHESPSHLHPHLSTSASPPLNKRKKKNDSGGEDLTSSVAYLLNKVKKMEKEQRDAQRELQKFKGESADGGRGGGGSEGGGGVAEADVHVDAEDGEETDVEEGGDDVSFITAKGVSNPLSLASSMSSSSSVVIDRVDGERDEEKGATREKEKEGGRGKEVLKIIEKVNINGVTGV